MSLITRCPACGTMFKVVPDQLRISEGWVRCGHCTEVFDASVHLQQDGPPSVAHAEPQVEPFDPFDAGPAADSDPAPVPYSASAHAGTYPDAYPDPTPAREPAPEPDPFDEPLFAPMDRQASGALAQASAPGRPDLLAHQDAGASPAQDAIGEPAEPAEEPPEHDVSFVRDARRKAFWRRPAVRVALFVAAVLLAMLLVLQAALNDRDRLAAAEPSLRPLLVALCEPLVCSVGPPRQIDAIVIDSSSFSKLRSDAYRLNFTLKNQATNEVAMPAIELTLTDTQDQPLLRRVLMPSDLGAKSPVIDASAEWSGSLALAVAGNGGPRVAGYRVLAFYP